MTYLLDTNAMSDLMRSAEPIMRWLSNLPVGSRVVTCAIVRGELLFGIARLAEGRRRAELQANLTAVLGLDPCEAVPERAGDHYATLKLQRQRAGRTRDENDLWVAATALALDATLVSRDCDFHGTTGLSIGSAS